MGKSRDNFTEVSRGPSPEQIFKESQMVGSNANRFARAICKDVLGINRKEIIKGQIQDRIIHADPKSIDSIRRKVRDNYDNDSTKLKDGARLTIFTESPDEMAEILSTFGDQFRNKTFNKDMQSKGYSFVERKDFISNPKRWGYMAMYMVMEVNNTKFEVQIYPRSMKATYDKTHGLYDLVRESGNLERWENACKKALSMGDDMPPMLDYMSYAEIALLKEILELHKKGATEAGLMRFVDKFPEMDDLPPMVVENDIAPYPQDVPHPRRAKQWRYEHPHNYDA